MSEKLHKVLADAGLGSRRQIERWISEGRVTVDDRKAKVGDRVLRGVAVKVDGRPVAIRCETQAPRVLVYHKPSGEICTRQDPQQRPTVFRHLPTLPTGRWICVGRLDLNTSGLLLFTNRGELADRLMHPRTGIEREYLVRITPPLTGQQKSRLKRGVDLDGQPARVDRLDELRQGSGRNRWYRMVLTEGRYREIRRLCKSVGVTVSRLVRVRYGTVQLPRDQRPGVWRELDKGAIDRLVAVTQRGSDQPPA
ncbi:MAG: rRNA pseudouridine synthase [Gammaproteobacteria bacterium]|nr:rRNA pseudouridine synthase [Gammaproteobacteria bacterium]